MLENEVLYIFDFCLLSIEILKCSKTLICFLDYVEVKDDKVTICLNALQGRLLKYSIKFWYLCLLLWLRCVTLIDVRISRCLSFLLFKTNITQFYIFYKKIFSICILVL